MIYQYNSNKELIAQHSTISAAAKANGCEPMRITECLQGQKAIKGSTFTTQKLK